MTGERRQWARLLWIPAAALVPVGYLAVHLTADLPEARMAKARVEVRNVATDGIEAFRWTRGRYPTNEEGIEAVIREGFARPTLADGKPPSHDPWGRAYLYALPGRVHPNSFDVCTYGADGRPGGDGENADICN